MNRTTEDSKIRAIMVGGDTIALEDGKIEMPPEQAKSSEKVLDNIIIGNFQEIKMEKARAEDILSKEQIIELQKYREDRKTEKALKRQAANQR